MLNSLIKRSGKVTINQFKITAAYHHYRSGAFAYKGLPQLFSTAY